MNKARFTSLARAELLADTAYYEALRKGLGARFREQVEKAASRAVAFPKSGRIVTGEIRRRRVNDFPPIRSCTWRPSTAS